MSGIAPDLPSSGWKVIYEPALTKFLSTADNLQYAGPVSDWIVDCLEHGPPDALDAGAEAFLAGIPGTELAAEYLVVSYEFLVIVKEFR